MRVIRELGGQFFENTHHHIGLHDRAAYKVSGRVTLKERKIPSNVASTCRFVSIMSEKTEPNIPNPSKYSAETGSKPIPPCEIKARKRVKYQNMSDTASNNGAPEVPKVD